MARPEFPENREFLREYFEKRRVHRRREKQCLFVHPLCDRSRFVSYDVAIGHREALGQSRAPK
jgi:hypothetical protein